MQSDSRPAPYALLITGTVGTGKTSAAYAAGTLLAHAGIPNAVIDLDWLRRSWPAPPNDRFNFGLLLRNLRCVASNYLDPGVTRLILAGVVESQDDRKHCHEAVGTDMSVCRLRVDLPVVRQRLALRPEGEPEALRWHMDRSGELDRILDQGQVEDFAIDATDLSVAEVAEATIEAVGWR
ncbi:adenylylsulfate kinase [Streptacidiphilus sp. MAP12-16]|uniref:hypothetical protein n=1 Tax=Streptacidiphilus sp. MAP12-16 TaxID=3156300 RepID=UPI0035143AA6